VGRAAGHGRPRIEREREKAAARGRTLRLGMRLHVVSRDTAGEVLPLLGVR
jgi:alkanesulfonate monooxygenase SsuD/methylene tetrahydromethanopterin reductase-like flavin-dependent oxidoreductase (luciferase family)